MQTSLIIGYLIVIFIFLYLTNINNLIEIFRGRKEFSCKRCGHCCRLLVQVSEKDISRLEKVGYKRKDFLEKKKDKYYIKRINGYCPWLKIENGNAKCKVYEYRPNICRIFPRKKIFKIKANDCRCNAFKKKFQ